MDALSFILALDGGEGGGGADANAVHYTADSNKTAEQKAQARANIGAVESGIIAADYSSLAFPIVVGTLCTHDGELYKANTTISTSEAWTAAHWMETSVDEEFVRTGSVSVTVTATDSTSPSSGVSVQLWQGDSVVETKAYTGQPVLFEGLVVGVEYTVKTTGGWTGKYNPTPTSYSFTATKATVSATVTYSLISQISTLAQLSQVIQEGRAADLTIGQQITIPWTDTATNTAYQVPCDIVDYRAVNDTDNPIVDENNVAHEGVRIQWHYATPFGISYDAPERVLATEETAVSGLYYYGKSGNTYTLLQLSAGDSIPYSSYDVIYKNEMSDASCEIIKSGYNRYRDSAIRQFLNSDGGIGEWWEATHAGDCPPSQLNSRAGFLSGFSDADIELMKKSKITCYTNTVTDGGVIDAMYDKWFLPSGTEMYGSVNANEGSYFPYWKEATGFASPSNGASVGRIVRYLTDRSTRKRHWLRSVVRNSSFYPYCVGDGGNILYYYGADNETWGLPVCAIY